MQVRPIVRDPARTGGRWHFDGTAIYIDTLVSDFRNARDASSVRAAYVAMGVNDAEIDAALAFSFPEVAPAYMAANAVALTVHCLCGVQRETLVYPPDYQTDLCSCGRAWSVDIALTPRVVAGTGPGSSP
jgi:uncharacterized protein (DUF433 family)